MVGKFILSKITTLFLEVRFFALCPKTDTALVIPRGTVMNTPNALTTLKGSKARNFFYLCENVVTKSLPDSERAEKIVAYLSDATFDFYFDRFTLGKDPTKEAKDYGLLRKVILENVSIGKTEYEIMREALTLQYDGADIPNFLSRTNKVYNQAKVGENVNKSN